VERPRGSPTCRRIFYTNKPNPNFCAWRRYGKREKVWGHVLGDTSGGGIL
jgi:hypothetical protein